jgi:hypothetical protein
MTPPRSGDGVHTTEAMKDASPMPNQSTKLTHALPGIYPGSNRTLHLALCGTTAITNAQSQLEPTCPVCAARVAANEAEELNF